MHPPALTVMGSSSSNAARSLLRACVASSQSKSPSCCRSLHCIIKRADRLMASPNT